MKAKAKVLLVGLDPKFVDYAALPEKLDEATLRAALDKDVARLTAAGYDARWLLTDRGETAVSVLEARLREEKFDCVMVGAGIRTIEPLFELFERLVNSIHLHAPTARIAFNSKPDDTPEAVMRWV